MCLPSTIHQKCWWEEISWAVVLFSFMNLVFNLIFLPILQAFIVLSCLISISVNFSTFLVIGKTSPVTYQVLGHLKTCLVLAFGYVLLHDPFSWRNIFGIMIALVGMVLYSYYCSLESQKKVIEASMLPQVLNNFRSFLPMDITSPLSISKCESSIEFLVF